MLSERQSHRTLVHHLDDLLLAPPPTGRSRKGHFLVHVVVVMVPLVLGVLISLALRHTGAAFTPCPYSVTGVAVGYIEDGY